jgi:glycosyltransferase involved in cell wall biosynthesis
MTPLLSVVIPTHNPDPTRLRATLAGLYSQTLPGDQCEIIVVNNASTSWSEAWFTAEGKRENLTVVDEPVLGLTAARIRGLTTSSGNIVVLVDDDNVLAPDYLANAIELFKSHPRLGAAGGKSLPHFEAPPPNWSREFFPLLALRDLGDSSLISSVHSDRADLDLEYPAFAPIGAGMVIRREAWAAWLEKIQSAGEAPGDRCGTQLTSGGDNDIVFCTLRAGWDVGYLPSLVLTHLIPAERTKPEYLGRLNRAIQKSWMHVLSRHGANPWAPLSFLGASARKLKAWFNHRSWHSQAAYIRWQGACGHFDGRVAIPARPWRRAYPKPTQ